MKDDFFNQLHSERDATAHKLEAIDNLLSFYYLEIKLEGRISKEDLIFDENINGDNFKTSLQPSAVEFDYLEYLSLRGKVFTKTLELLKRLRNEFGLNTWIPFNSNAVTQILKETECKQSAAFVKRHPDIFELKKTSQKGNIIMFKILK